MPWPKQPGPRKSPPKKKRPGHTIAVKAFLSAVFDSNGVSREELIDLCGLHESTVYTYLKAFSTGVRRFIYVEKYVRYQNRGNWTAIYKYGIDQPNAPFPTPLPKPRPKKGPVNWIKVLTDKGMHYEYTGIFISRADLDKFPRDERTAHRPHHG